MSARVETGNGWTMYLGDCIDVMQTLGQVDHVICDPPYEKDVHTKARRSLKDATQRKGARNTGEVRRIYQPLEISFAAITEDERSLAAEGMAKVAKRWVIAFCQIEAVGKWRTCFELGGLEWVRGGIWCISGGARVYVRTVNGDRPMTVKDLVRLKPEKVQLWNGSKWTRVLGWSKSARTGDELEFTLRSGERIACTRGHVWPTDRGNVRAEDLREGDVLQSCTLPEPVTPRRPSSLGDEMVGWFVGLYIAEGSRGTDGAIQIASHIRESDRFDRLREIALAFDGTCKVHQTSKNGCTVNLYGSVLGGIIDAYVGGRVAKDKHLNVRCWRRSNRFLRALLEGYLHGDGHYDIANDRWRIGFCRNYSLEDDIRTLCARLDVQLRLRLATSSICGRRFPSFRGEIRFIKPAHHNAKKDTEIVAIGRGRARCYWDVGVEDEPHLFALASGVLTHNSKPNGAPQFTGDRPGQGFESLAIGHCPGKKRWNGGGKHAVWTHSLDQRSESSGRHEHPAQKPIALMLDLVSDFTDPCETILDPFAGSGTTGVACLRLGRRFIGIEKDEKYFELACERLRAEESSQTLASRRAGQTSLLDLLNRESA